MTIRVTVKNEDVGESRVITVQQQTLDGLPINGQFARQLKGGESVESYVHDLNQIVVKELSPAPDPLAKAFDDGVLSPNVTTPPSTA